MVSTPPSAFSAEAVDADLEEPTVIPFGAWLGPIFSFLGILAIDMPQMAVFSVVGILLSMLALRWGLGARLHPVGRGLAYVGVVVGSFLLVLAISVHYLQRQHLSQSAERFARDWLEVLYQGEIHYAAQLTTSRSARQLPGADLVKYYSEQPEEVGFQIQSLEDTSWLKEARLAQKKPEWVRVGPIRLNRNYGTWRVEMTFEDASGVVSDPVTVAMKREVDPKTEAGEWWTAYNE